MEIDLRNGCAWVFRISLQPGGFPFFFTRSLLRQSLNFSSEPYPLRELNIIWRSRSHPEIHIKCGKLEFRSILFAVSPLFSFAEPECSKLMRKAMLIIHSWNNINDGLYFVIGLLWSCGMCVKRLSRILIIKNPLSELSLVLGWQNFTTTAFSCWTGWPIWKLEMFNWCVNAIDLLA